MHPPSGLACRVGHCHQAHLQGDFYGAVLSLPQAAGFCCPSALSSAPPSPLHFCYPGAIITLQHPVLKSAQDCFQGCRPTFRGVGETLCHTGGEGLLGTRTDGTLTVVVGQLLKDRGRPQSPGSLATEVASAPSRSPSQHQADGQREVELGPWSPGDFCLGCPCVRRAQPLVSRASNTPRAVDTITSASTQPSA